MKMELRTLLKDLDDMPSIYFENLDSDKQKEVFLNEYWKYTTDENNIEIKDIVDTKQQFFFGRSFDQMQIIDGLIRFTIIDPEDILVSRYTDPTDIDTARFLIHTHIFVPLTVLENTPEYDQEKIKDLKLWYGSTMGLIKQQQNKLEFDEKQKRLADLGILDAYAPVLGETYVELSLHFCYQRNPATKEEELYEFVEAENRSILLEKTQESIIGKTADHYWRNHFAYNSWADDIEMQDFWNDGPADIIRPANQILDVWFSQLVENRTLRSFGMHFFNSNLEGYTPQTWQPIPFGAYGIPIPTNGDIRQHIQKIEIPDLTESIDEMKYVQEMTERATGALANQQGALPDRQVTLGAVQIALGEAKERARGTAKFKVKVWEQRAKKFLKFIEAAPDKLDAVKIFKKGRNTDAIYNKTIGPNDWKSELGYRVKIWSQNDKYSNDTKTLEKMNAAMANIPGNPVLTEEFRKKILEFADISPEKVVEILDFEKNKAQMPQIGPDGQPIPTSGGGINPPAPAQPPVLPVKPATAPQMGAV